MKSKILPLVFSVSALLAPARAATDGVSSPNIAKSVQQELGAVHGDYFVPNRPVSAQIMMGLGIPNPVRPIADGNLLRSGCRPHSCDEKSAVIVTPAGAMLAAGLIYLSCDGDLDKRRPAVDCKLRPRLRIFMKQKNDRPALVQELKDWAAREGFTGTAEKQILRP